ncbi:MAG: hypothetical protein JW388_1519 [Nitrospira sp.]|nr:hypothetical protein [Nitrospira sp.]
MTDPTCKACSADWPDKDRFIADLSLTRVYLHEDQFFPGWTVLFLKRHATELFELTKDERAQLIEDVSLIAKILAQVYGAKKMNYELLGNQLPHIHWHVIPRLATEQASLEPVWRIEHEPLRLTPLDSQTQIQLIQKQLQP